MKNRDESRSEFFGFIHFMEYVQNNAANRRKEPVK